MLGAGTGLGIAQLVNVGGKWTVISGEGGHVDLGPRTQREFAIWPHLAKQQGRMSAEEALSGRGMENLFEAICAADGIDSGKPAAAAISAMAADNSNPQAVEAVALFFTLLARLAGDMALLTLSRGGIYLAGGIAQKLMPLLDKARFRADFEDKAPHQAIMRGIPVMVMTHPTAALEGLAAWVRQPGRLQSRGRCPALCLTYCGGRRRLCKPDAALVLEPRISFRQGRKPCVNTGRMSCGAWSCTG